MLRRVCGAVALALAAAFVLTWAAPAPAEILTALRSPQDWVGRRGADHAVLTVTAAAGWLLLGWLVTGLAITALTALPGMTGHAARLLARVMLPRAARQALAVALGVGLVTAGAGAAGADPPPVPSGASAPGATVDWPVQPPLVEPPQTAPPSTGPPAGGPPGFGDPVDGAVLVRSGDSLWSIAAARLGPRAGSGEVAAAVHGWYAENRAVIGADPDLILPGQRLLPPEQGS